MILPLHHCDAVGCMRMTDPGELMCREHWPLVKEETVKLLLAADTKDKRFQAELLARGDVMLAEHKNLLPCAASPAASQEKPHPTSSVPGDADSPKESTS